jgi:hypothetical protein
MGCKLLLSLTLLSLAGCVVATPAAPPQQTTTYVTPAAPTTSTTTVVRSPY